MHTQANSSTIVLLTPTNALRCSANGTLLNITLIYTVYAVAMFVFNFVFKSMCNYIWSKVKSSLSLESRTLVGLPQVKRVILKHISFSLKTNCMGVSAAFLWWLVVSWRGKIVCSIHCKRSSGQLLESALNSAVWRGILLVFRRKNILILKMLLKRS